MSLFLAVMSFLCVVFSRFCDGGRIFVFWCEDGVSGKIKYTYVYIYICILAFTFGINQHTTTSNSIGFCAVLCGFVLPWLPFSPCRNKLKLPNVAQVSKRLKLSHFHAIGSGKQPTKMTSLPSVPEFSHIVVINHLPSQFAFNLQDGSLKHCTLLVLHGDQLLVPCKSKLLRKTNKKGGDGRLLHVKFSVDITPSLHALGDLDSNISCDEVPLACNCGEAVCNPVKIVVEQPQADGDCSDFVFGVRWSPENFMKRAIQVGHPFKDFSGLQPEVKRACERLSEMSHEDVVNLRCKKLGEWLRLARNLGAEELDIKSRMPPARRHILGDKRIALMRQIIQLEGYEDQRLADDVEHGFSLVGDSPASTVLPPKLVPATISKDDLCRNADKANKALRFMTRSSGDLELDESLWAKTQAEVEKGWLVGPIPWDQLPAGSAVSRRFPLAQAGKIRPIDDLSQSQVNSTVNTFEQATVDGPDVICSYAVFFMRCLSSNGQSTQLLGRSLDLASAYRQLAIADDSLQHSYLSVFDPTVSEAALFQQVALPFGSRSAVNAFIRCARFLQWIAARAFLLPLSCYFDDFVSFSTPALCPNSQSTLCLMLDILGWKFDREGAKSDSCTQLVSALGVQFKLDGTVSGTLNVCNTEKRIADTTKLLEDVIRADKLSKKDALILRGKLAFCDAFIFGRVGKVALQDLTKHAYANPFCSGLSARVAESLALLRERLLQGKPRVLSCKLLDTFFLFTDASFDKHAGAGFGGVLVSPSGDVVSWYGLHVVATRFDTWFEHGRQWGPKLSSVQLMAYVDNEGAKFSLIRGYSDSPSITFICALVALHLDHCCIMPWFSRVPSASNISDYPSRKTSHHLLKEATSVPEGDTHAVFEESLKQVESHIYKGGVRG